MVSDVNLHPYNEGGAYRLAEIDLSWNRFGDGAAAQSIAQACADAPEQLRVLRLGNNRVDGRDAQQPAL